ncbi:FAD/NAD(P)-binding domain-containing protein [Mycena chlorophos]|uniref:FAD/NAD(P)-binding domain-containing protein n=1 Tax=Mycena chlorophos TaxID=658473 RepID=A0A8H6TDH7_MYCCL|nr:FAD/NAD(P)-binding domain-containing protein [Mycena chlorophos]
MTHLKTIVVVGGSYSHQVVLIEKNSHIHHIFAFPRISVVPGFEQKAFIPLTNAFHAAPRDSVSVIQGIVENILSDCVVLDDGQSIPYDYLVVATGTGRPPLALTSKPDETNSKKALQQRLRQSEEVVIVGGGGYGLQLAFDAKEFYPTKNITLIHSRSQLMRRFHPQLHAIVSARAEALGIRLILGKRATIPVGGFPVSGPRYNVELSDGTLVPADLAFACIGAVALSGPLHAVSPHSVHARTHEILVKPTMQIIDSRFPRVFAVGDVAAANAHKAVGPGRRQAAVAVGNIVQMSRGCSANNVYVPGARKIRLSLGLHSDVTLTNPTQENREPTVEFVDLGDGTHDEAEVARLFECRVQSVWEWRAVGVADYYL